MIGSKIYVDRLGSAYTGVDSVGNISGRKTFNPIGDKLLRRALYRTDGMTSTRRKNMDTRNEKDALAKDTDRQTNRQTERQTDTQTDTQTYRQIHRQTDRQIH